MNARWQFNANGVYVAPYGIELAANVFGRQGYPMPLFRPGSTAALGSDSSLNVLVSPTIDYVRYPNVWDTDIRVARDFKTRRACTVRGMFDVFNLLNANTALVRNGNVTATDGFNADRAEPEPAHRARRRADRVLRPQAVPVGTACQTRLAGLQCLPVTSKLSKAIPIASQGR